MANIHITLVGGQTTPVYQGIIATNPDRVILIHSAQTETEASRIYAEMDVDCELRKFDPVDLRQIIDALNKLKESFSVNDRITINVGGGTKPWSIMFFEHFRGEENVQLFYIDQNNLMWNLKTNEKTEVSFDMDVQFRLLGNVPVNFRNFSIYSSEDLETCATIRKLYNFNSYDFQFLSKNLLEYFGSDLQESKSGSTMCWIEHEKELDVKLVNKIGKSVSAILKSEKLVEMLYNTGWFEIENAKLLSRWHRVTEIRLNCVFPAHEGTAKNEIDIIVNAGSKLLFVECKTRIFNETDIDKFASAVKVYGGLGSKALFVTDYPMTEKAIEKCADHGIMTFCLQSNLYHFPSESLLFKMLDSELFNLNAK